MTNPDETWMGVELFRSLLELLGAKRVAAMDGFAMYKPDLEHWEIKLQCLARDKQKAQELSEAVGAYWASPRAEHERPLPPWREVEKNLEAAIEHGIIQRKLLASTEDKLRFANSYKEPTRTEWWRTSFDIHPGEVLDNEQYLIFAFPLVWELAVAALISYLHVNGCRDFHCSLATVDKEDT